MDLHAPPACAVALASGETRHVTRILQKKAKE
jgi:hypothetical protein